MQDAWIQISKHICRLIRACIFCRWTVLEINEQDGGRHFSILMIHKLKLEIFCGGKGEGEGVICYISSITVIILCIRTPYLLTILVLKFKIVHFNTSLCV